MGSFLHARPRPTHRNSEQLSPKTSKKIWTDGVESSLNTGAIKSPKTTFKRTKTKKKYYTNKNNYINANPFPNIVIDDFFDEGFLNDVLNEFPNLSKKQNSDSYVNQNEIKFANNLYSDFSKNIKLLFDFLNSNYFVGFLQKITNINEKLIIDEKLNGGGLHEIKKGGHLF